MQPAETVAIAMGIVILVLIAMYTILFFMYSDMKKMYGQTISDATELLSKERKKEKTVVYSFGKMDKYTDEDLNAIRSSPQSLEALMKILGNFTIMRNDSLRDPANRERINEVIGECNAFNEMIFFFYKLTLTPKQIEDMNN